MAVIVQMSDLTQSVFFCFFFNQKSLENHQLIHELLKIGTFKSQNIVKSFKRSFNSKMSGRNIPHEPNRQSGG